MADQKRNGPEGRVIEFAGGVFTDMPVNERPCEYLENLLPPMGGGKGLEPRDGIDFVVRLWPPYEGDTDTHIYDVYNPDDMTQTHLIACYNVDTNEIVHLTTHTDQEGRKSIPPLGGGSLVLTPIAVDDLYFTTKEVTLEVEAPGVMSNDEDLGEDATVSVVSQPLNGTVTLNPDGSFEYQPLPDFVGLDSFTYIITSLGLTSNVGRVVVSVGSGEEGPDAFTFKTEDLGPGENPVEADELESIGYYVKYTGTPDRNLGLGFLVMHTIYNAGSGDYFFQSVRYLGGYFPALEPGQSEIFVYVTVPYFDSGHYNGHPDSFQSLECYLVETVDYDGLGAPVVKMPMAWKTTIRPPG